MQDTVDLNEYFIYEKRITESFALFLQTVCVFKPELVAPKSDGFVTDCYASL